MNFVLSSFDWTSLDLPQSLIPIQNTPSLRTNPVDRSTPRWTRGPWPTPRLAGEGGSLQEGVGSAFTPGPAGSGCGARGWGRKCWKHKDSPEGQPPQRLGLRGFQGSLGSQVRLGPPRKRKNKIKRSVSSRREPAYKRYHAPPTILTAGHQHLSASWTLRVPPTDPRRPITYPVHHTCAFQGTMPQLWPWFPVWLSQDDPPLCDHSSKFSCFLQTSSRPHPDLTPDSTMHLHFQSAPKSPILCQYFAEYLYFAGHVSRGWERQEWLTYNHCLCEQWLIECGLKFCLQGSFTIDSKKWQVLRGFYKGGWGVTIGATTPAGGMLTKPEDTYRAPCLTQPGSELPAS